VARDANGNPVNAYHAKVQAVTPGNTTSSYRVFSASAVADGTEPSEARSSPKSNMK